jgi:predicted enzyme related to lactoylglutathione lyase
VLGTPSREDAEHVGFELEPGYFGLEVPNEFSGEPVTVWFGVDDVEGFYRRFLDAGATSHVAPQGGGKETMAAVRDPEGNVIGLVGPYTGS